MKQSTAILKVTLLLSFTLAASSISAQSLLTEVIYDCASSDIFPESWLTERINAKAEMLVESERRRCEEIVANSLAKYPVDLLNANLKKLYLLGGLEYRGARTGGTNSRTVVYLVGKPSYKSSDIEKNLHAEFSSILLRNFARHFDTAKWHQLNPSDFQYGNGGVRAVLEKTASSRLDKTKLERGFLSQYAQASIQEDFNSFAGRLFVGEEELWNAIETHSKIRAKANYAMAFYERIDSRLNENFFQSLRRSP